MAEFYYWRESSSGGKSRLESVVLYLPDVWSAQPTRADWRDIQEGYRSTCDAALARLEAPAPEPATEPAAAAAAASDADSSLIVCSQYCLL